MLDYFGLIFYILVCFLMSIVIPAILFFYVGLAGLVGIGIIICISLIQMYGTKFNTKLRLKIGAFADNRIEKTK